MLRSSLCDYSGTYIFFKRTIAVPNTGTAATSNNRNKKVLLRNCAPFTDCTNEINNKEIDHTKDIDVVMPMYNLIEYRDSYSKTFGSLQQYCRDEPFTNNDVIFDVPDDRDRTLS